MGCRTNSVHVVPSNDYVMSRGTVTWIMMDSDGRRLTMDELKETIKVPLTEAEVFFVTKSWKTIRRNMVNIGVAMFLRCDIPSYYCCRVHVQTSKLTDYCTFMLQFDSVFYLPCDGKMSIHFRN